MNTALEVRDLSVSFGGVAAVQGVSFCARSGEVLSIIGPNGAGKTTVFNIISGIYRPDAGHISLHGEDVSGVPAFRLARSGLSRTFQNIQILADQTVLDNVSIGRCRWEHTSLLADLFRFPSVVAQNEETRRKSLMALDAVGLARQADVLAANLPYGDLKRLEIARAMASEPTVLLLDEPAAGCNAVETDAINEVIRTFVAADARRAVVLIEHDMKMVMAISNQIVVLNQGRVLACGSPEEVRGNAQVVEAYLGAQSVEDAAHAAD